jgi:hypothetical protein
MAAEVLTKNFPNDMYELVQKIRSLDKRSFLLIDFKVNIVSKGRAELWFGFTKY